MPDLGVVEIEALVQRARSNALKADKELVGELMRLGHGLAANAHIKSIVDMVGAFATVVRCQARDIEAMAEDLKQAKAQIDVYEQYLE